MSPGFFPGAGISLVAVVLLLIMPIAASSARIAEIVAAEVSPGIAIISNPTEHTQVMASNFSKERLPRCTASIIPRSSLTGINAPDRPPTLEDAMRPPFFTESFKSASAAVVPGPPQLSNPISSNTCATLSPTAAVGANDKSTIPKEA